MSDTPDRGLIAPYTRRGLSGLALLVDGDMGTDPARAWHVLNWSLC